MLGKLEYLIALSAEKNFGRAAERCAVAQPSFSAGIRALEEALGVPLVIRSSRFQCFTPEGEVVLDWARRITGDVLRGRRDGNALMGRLVQQSPPYGANRQYPARRGPGKILSYAGSLADGSIT